jgi:dihydroorotate dehydrogenase electron transfer subunit
MSQAVLHRGRSVQTKARILDHTEVAPDHWRMGLAPEIDFSRAEPGQFVMLGLGAAAPRLWRRPFSIHRQAVGRLELLYRVVGPTTRVMAELPPGAAVDLVGPLGRGFRVPDGLERIGLAAGGIGAAPIVFLAETLVHRLPRSCAVEVFLGGRSRVDLLCREDFQQLGLPVTVTTDDGSDGAHCLVTVPLEQAADRKPHDLICACGPPAMLRCVARMALARGIACQVSIEALMACGLGACLGCAVRGSDPAAGYRHVCREGPVFDAADLDWSVPAETITR